MKVLGLLLALEFLFGCAHGLPRKEVRATDRNARLVRQVLWVGSREIWERSPWYRMAQDTIEWPRRIVLAVDGSACLMDLRDVNEPEPTTYWACATPWRVAR